MKVGQKKRQSTLYGWLDPQVGPEQPIEMSRSERRTLTKEEILAELRNIARSTGRPPSRNDQGVQKLVYAATKEFGSWHHALTVAGLQTYKEWKRDHSRIGRIRRFLKNNPSTLIEIRKAFSADSSADVMNCIKQHEDIKSIGPRRKKVYFVSGQEQLAQRKLEEVLNEVDPLTEIVYFLLQRPMTYEQLEASAKSQAEIEGAMFSEEKVKGVLKILRMAHIVYKAEFTRTGAHSGTPYSCFDLFGDLANKAYYCRYDCPREMANFVGSLLPVAAARKSSGRRRSLTLHLKRILPRDVLESLAWIYE